MKVATFNINNINKRLDNLLAWLVKAEPDVVSLQEIKAEQQAFPEKPFGLSGTKQSARAALRKNLAEDERRVTKRTMSQTSHIRFEKTIGQNSFQRKKEFLNASCR